MEKELHERLAPKNKIVEQYQRGLLSDKEFDRMMAEQDKADMIDKEWHNADLIQDEQEEISQKEVMEAEQYADRAERDAEEVKNS